ncbi:class I SAM-dependent methyltransferase [Brevibacterium casei]|uniref:class I SAM-dependent methyltransferase n=1 Tax=Brevibacterium casei TaxID=33889 RepID=UPI003EBE351B
MKNAGIYRVGLYSVLALGLALVAVVMVTNVLREYDQSIILGVVGLIILVMLLAGIGHIRMRMNFEVVNRKLEQNVARQAKAMSRLESDNTILRNSVIDAIATHKTILQSDATNKINAIEREIIANDSLSEARASSISRQISRSESESVSRIDNLEIALDKIEKALGELVSGIEHKFADFQSTEIKFYSESVQKLNQRITRNEAALDRVATRLSSMVSVIKMSNSWKSDVSGRLSKIDELSSGIDDLYDRQDCALTEIAASLAGLSASSERLANAHRDGQEESLTQLSRISERLITRGDLSSHNVHMSTTIKTHDRDMRRVQSEILASVAQLEKSFGKFDRRLAQVEQDLKGEILHSSTACGNDSSLVDLVGDVEEKFGASLTAIRSEYSSIVEQLKITERGVFRLQELVPLSRSQLEKTDDNLIVSKETSNLINEAKQSVENGLTSLSEQAQKFFNATQNKLQHQRSATEALPKDVRDYAALLNRFNIESTRTPDIGGWSATVPVVSTLVNEILQNPKVVENSLDVGSGSSTFWSALAMRERGYGIAYALEHDPIYANRLREKLRDNDLDQWAVVVEAPLVPWAPSISYPCPKNRLPDKWYSADRLGDLSLGLVFVDGPPGEPGKYSRLPALEVLWPNLRDGALLVLDDTIRSEEREIASIWTQLAMDHGKVEFDSNLIKSAVLRVSRTL